MSIDLPAGSPPARVAFYNDPKVRSIAYQVALCAVIGFLVYAAARNAITNLERAHIASGFGFWNNTAGFDISQTLIQFDSQTSSYGRAFWVGLLNTLLVAGIGIVEGHEVLVIASDAMIKGGAVYPMGVKKNLRCQTISMENRLPIVSLLDSAGAFLPLQSEIFPDVDDGGRIFYNQAIISKMGIPQITAVMGLCTAGGAYMPAMSDEVVHVKGTGAIFLGGPPLVKAATGEEVTADELGGAEVHCIESGVSDYFAEDDAQAIAIVRKIVQTLPKNEKARLTLRQPKPPVYDPKEIYGIVSRDLKVPYDCREIIARLVDGSEFLEFKELYGPTLVCGFAYIHGFPVGILGNNGILFSNSSLKATQFIQICDRRGIPLVFLQNINGYIIGKQYERLGITKDGHKMVNAVSTCTVPKFTVIVGASFGAVSYTHLTLPTTPYV